MILCTGHGPIFIIKSPPKPTDPGRIEKGISHSKTLFINCPNVFALPYGFSSSAPEILRQKDY